MEPITTTPTIETVNGAPKYRVLEGKVNLTVDTVTPRTDGKEGESIKFRTLIKGEELMPGIVEPDRTKYFYMWAKKGPEVGKVIPADLSLFVVKRVEDEWTTEEGEDMETTRDILERRANHVSGL